MYAVIERNLFTQTSLFESQDPEVAYNVMKGLEETYDNLSIIKK